MAFEGLSGRLSEVFKKLKGRGKVKESDIKEVMREVRMALLEADVSYKVVKDFVAAVTERVTGSDVLESLTPAQQVIKIVNEELTRMMGGTNAKIAFANSGPADHQDRQRPAHRADGLYQRPHQLRLEKSDRHHDVWPSGRR